MAAREYHYRWEFDLKADPEQLWPFVADTNRFNRDTGVPKIEIEANEKRLRNARRRVRLTIYGLPVEWEEQPFEWIRPAKFGIERTYSRGPILRMRALAELTARVEGGTHLTYDVWTTPRNLLGHLFIPLQIKFIISPKLRAAFEKYDKLAVAGMPIDSAGTPPELSAHDEQRLKSLGQKLLADLGNSELPEAKSHIAEKLVAYIRQSDDFGVARMRPYQLADDWQQPRRLVLEVFLRATRIGLLDFQWELLCPLCRGAKESTSSLKDISTEVHCGTCRIDFKANFDRYVELTFRPNAAVRRVDVHEFCIGSPQRSPHIVAQQLLRPNETRKLDLPLGSGNYRFRALEIDGAQQILVSSEGEGTATISLQREQFDGATLNVAKRCTYDLSNETAEEQLLILERMAWSDQATTAAEVTALQMFRDLFSTEALRPGEQISVGTLTVLFTDLRHSTQLYREIGDATAFGKVMNHFDVLRKVIGDNDGAVVKTIGDAIMAVFRSPADAVRAMVKVQYELAHPTDNNLPLQLKAGIHSGPCIAVTLNDRLDYFGSTVNAAARLEGLSTGTDVVVSSAIYEDAEVQELIETESLSAEGFAMSLKGFENERFELWRISRGSIEVLTN
jgi:class 3 adenylate cyclase